MTKEEAAKVFFGMIELSSAIKAIEKDDNAKCEFSDAMHTFCERFSIELNKSELSIDYIKSKEVIQEIDKVMNQKLIELGLLEAEQP